MTDIQKDEKIKRRKDRKMTRQKSLNDSIAYQLFLHYGEPCSMPTALVKSQEVKRFTMSYTAAPRTVVVSK